MHVLSRIHLISLEADSTITTEIWVFVSSFSSLPSWSHFSLASLPLSHQALTQVSRFFLNERKCKFLQKSPQKRKTAIPLAHAQNPVHSRNSKWIRNVFKSYVVMVIKKKIKYIVNYEIMQAIQVYIYRNSI